jgi:hypothetical protein
MDTIEQVQVPEGENLIVARAEGHSWISLSTMDFEIVRQHGDAPFA